MNRLEPIVEPVFDAANFGYRRGRSTKDALKKIGRELQGGYEWIVDADLKDFFGSVDHEKLLALVSQKIADGRVLRLIEGMLKAGSVVKGTKGVFEELDGWIRRKLRNILWRRWKRTFTRARNLMRRGLAKDRAWKSAFNGCGPWWNSGALHMNQAFPKKYFDDGGLASLFDQHRTFQRVR